MQKSLEPPGAELVGVDLVVVGDLVELLELGPLLGEEGGAVDIGLGEALKRLTSSSASFSVPRM